MVKTWLVLAVALAQVGCEQGGHFTWDDDTADDDTTGIPADDDTAMPDDDAADDDTFPEVTIGDWEPCAWVPGGDTDQAECAEALLPLDYSQPDDLGLDVLVKRRLGAGQSTAQLWLLHGGPGASAIDEMSFLAYTVPGELPDIDLYAIDHRGIGGSGQLECPEQEDPGSEWGESISDAEWPDCIAALQSQWGDGLDEINTTNSARDLGVLIDLLAGGDQRVLLYGGSYGTYLGLRYLQLFPEQPDGVVLDGISAPGQGFMEYDWGMDLTGHKLMDTCGEDPTCAPHFDGDPWEVAQDVVASFDAGHCSQLAADADVMRYFLGAMLMYDKVRDLVPATVHRMGRCNTDDVDVIVHLYYAYFDAVGQSAWPAPPSRWLGGQTGNEGTGYSNQLFYHVATSEMWDPQTGPSPAEAVDAWETYTMATGLTTWVASSYEMWPRFDPDEYNGGFADYSGPLLMLQGGLDPATPVEHAEVVGDHFDGPAQTWAYFPQGAHGMVTGTSMASGDNCGELLYLAFLADPGQELDLGCIGDTLPVNFNGYPDYNQYFLGTYDAWGD